MSVPLTSDFSRTHEVPYFLWDEPMTVAELHARLEAGNRDERLRLLGKILREARDTEVWLFTTPSEVVREWSALEPHLGRRRGFWEFLLEAWRRERLIGA